MLVVSGGNQVTRDVFSAINSYQEIERICYAALSAGKSIRAMRFNFGPFRESGCLLIEEAEKIEADWEVESLCREVASMWQKEEAEAVAIVDKIAPIKVEVVE